MYIIVFGSLLKLVLTFALVAGFGLKVVGVGLATLISNLLISILLFSALLKKKDVVTLNPKEIKIDITELKEILLVGIPTGLQTSFFSLANVLITSVVSTFGEAAATGISIANQFDGILSLISCAPSYATMSYVAQNVGAGNFKRVKQTVFRSILITVSFGATLGALSAIFSGELSSIISTNPEIIAYSRQKMIIISSTYFLSGINETMGGVVKGIGKPILPAITTFVFMCLLRFFWVYVVFPLCPNLTFLYAVWPIGWTCAITTLFAIYLPSIRKMELSGQRA
jgi:Na+-driven multidrug efflux pump